MTDHDVQIPPVGTVHACPPGDSGLTPCCGKTLFELPDTDRVDGVGDGKSVTCGTGTKRGRIVSDGTARGTTVEIEGKRLRGVTRVSWVVGVEDKVAHATVDFLPVEMQVAMTFVDDSDSAEKLARAFHEHYELLAPTYGYETRRRSAVPWDEVPENNRRLMLATASAVIADMRTGAFKRAAG